MKNENSNNLNELIAKLEMTTGDKKKINEIKKLIKEGDLDLTMKKIEELFAEENIEEEKEVANQGKDEDEISYPEQLKDNHLEYIFIGLLLNHPKFIAKYYFLYEDCLFEDPELLNIYKSILFFEGAKYALEISKKDFSFSKDTAGVYQLKQKIKNETSKIN